MTSPFGLPITFRTPGSATVDIATADPNCAPSERIAHPRRPEGSIGSPASAPMDVFAPFTIA
ncbi:hypothetical protein GCM10023081_08760 [Arthrobacter ginkgonis]|uniref:Uncharacterized protein n=1 Tax=Arthrobacter ginkgonis TaxID=1630594 RepID=A0ABP7C0N2_9MICC